MPHPTPNDTPPRRTNGARLAALIAAAGLDIEQARDLFNNASPRPEMPCPAEVWAGLFVTPGNPGWRPFSDKLLERAEKVFAQEKGKQGTEL